jgi:putative ABC transport system permease protein
MNHSLALAFKNLKRNKRRNFATGVAIAFGFAGLLLLGGYVFRVNNYLRVYTVYGNRGGHIIIYKKSGLQKFAFKPKDYSLDANEQAQLTAIIDKLGNIEFHGSQLSGSGLIGNGCKTLPFLGHGIDPEIDRRLMEHPEMRRWAPNLSDLKKGRGIWNFDESGGPIAVSTGLARLLGKSKVHDDFVGDQPIVIVDCLASDSKEKISLDTNVQLAAGSWSGMLSALDGDIVAHYNTGLTDTNNSSIIAPLHHLQKLYDTDQVTFHSIWLKNPSKLESTVKSLKEALALTPLELDIYKWNEEAINPMYVGTMDFLFTMIGFIVCVMCTVIAFAIFNSATMTVIERSQEIGMLRALGFTKRRIRLLYVYEILLLATMSLVSGGIIAICAMLAVNRADIRFNPPGVAGGLQLMLIPNATITAIAALLVVALATVATWIAVRAIAKRNIAGLLLGTQR